MKENKTRMIIYLGILIAIGIVLTRFLSIPTPFVRIGIGFLPTVIAGILFGPFYAALMAVIKDILGTLFFSSTGFFPGFTLSAMISGLVYGGFLYNRPRSFWRVATVTLIEKVFVSLLLNTYWLYLITGKGFLILLPTRILNSIGTAPAMFLLIWYVAYPLCDQLKNREEHKK